MGSKEFPRPLITINGGTVTATSGDSGAGIGGGFKGAGGEITITGGTVTATGSAGGAGIGGGSYGAGGEITITGGTVTATAIGNYGGAGIGGGLNAAGGEITITGGTVTATGSDRGAGVGGGSYGAGGEITINGGTVTATGGTNGAGIGGGTNEAGGTVIITGGNIKATSVSGTLTNGGENPKNLSLVKITLAGMTENTVISSITGADNYGLKDVSTFEGELYLYLPNNQITNINANGQDYIPKSLGDNRFYKLITVTADSEGTVTYDGNAHAGYKNLSNDKMINITYAYHYEGIKGTKYDSKEAPKDAGDYTVTIDTNDTVYYSPTITRDFSIVKKSIIVTINSASSTYGDAIAELTAEDNGIVKGDQIQNVYTLHTTVTKTSPVGTYDITGTGINDNYDITFKNETTSYQIKERELTVDVQIKDKQYDGKKEATIQSATLQNVLEKDKDKVGLDPSYPTATFVSESEKTGIQVNLNGNFQLSGEESVLKNYKIKQPTGVTGNIINNWDPVKDTEYSITSKANDNGWLNKEFEITAKEGYELSLGNEVASEWKDTLTGTTEGNDSELAFYVRNTKTGAISRQKGEKYNLDQNTETSKTTATVSIKQGEKRESWQEFLNTITFNLFFKEKVNVTVSAEDTLSGVDEIAYYVCESKDKKHLTLENVKKITDWKEMQSDGVTVSVEDEKQFVVYIRVTDKAGNISYFSTDGVEYDTTAPRITGVDNGGIYYTTQVVTVTDKNLSKVEVNGKEVELTPIADAKGKTAQPNGTLTLAGNIEKEYIITVTDKVGNQSSITITMKTIASLKEPVQDITIENVKSSDEETIKEVLKSVEELLEENNLTEAEKQELETIKGELNKLLGKIEEVQKALENLNEETIKKTEGITSENVTSNDKKTLEDAKAEIEKIQTDYANNLTEEEKKDLQKELERIEKVLEIIKKVEEVEALSKELPETITKADTDAVKKASSAPTGDDNAALLWLTLLLVGGIGVCGIVVWEKKKKQSMK